MDIIKEIERLVKLKDAGHLSDAEYQDLKSRLLHVKLNTQFNETSVDEENNNESQTGSESEYLGTNLDRGMEVLINMANDAKEKQYNLGFADEKKSENISRLVKQVCEESQILERSESVGLNPFPGGNAQLSEVLYATIPILYPEIIEEELTYDEVLFSCYPYIDTFSRKVLLGYTAEKIVAAIIVKYDWIPEVIVKSVVDKSLEIIHKYFPEIKAKDELPESFKTLFTNDNDDDFIEQFVSDPEYGLVPEKPIFTAGHAESYVYLDKLISCDGVPITYSRESSMNVDGIRGFVDVYCIKYFDGRPDVKLYLCLYSNRTSKESPKGFELRDYSEFFKGMRESKGFDELVKSFANKPEVLKSIGELLTKAKKP